VEPNHHCCVCLEGVLKNKFAFTCILGLVCDKERNGAVSLVINKFEMTGQEEIMA
jgi:hypothetical protein